ncbi:MAG TPA: hypothetical protein VFL83_12630 [Anaeromyxobacter sp.]|nr:hypothetical protein [Anaeromyxobacter sp.]
MPSAIAARRLEIYAAARSDPAAFLRLERDGLRFSLGTSIADLAVPIQIAADARAIVRGAISDAALLLSTHHRGFVPTDDVDRLILREEYASLPAADARLGPSVGGPDLRGAAQLAAAVHPALTGGLVTAWMGKGGRGRSLVALWIELLRRAFDEMAATRGRERTPLLVALALSSECAAAERELRPVLPSPPLDRYLRAAALAASWLAARTGLARAWRDAGRGVEDPLLARLEAAISPAALLGGRSGVTQGGATVYGCDLSAGIPHADEHAALLAAGGDPDRVRDDVVAALARDDDLALRAEAAVAVTRARDLLGAAVAAAEDAGAAARLAALRALFSAPGALASALGGDAERKALVRDLAHAAPGGDAGGLLDRTIRVVKGWKPREPAAAVGLDRRAARAEYAAAATALLADVALERAAASVRRGLSFRTGREAEGGADAEWEAGRLYRISARPAPILQDAKERLTGHLFADVKDFTRRTALLGQASMAEFLRREFYVPILVSAKEHFGGMQHLADRGGVALNNLLGDAVSFAGRVDEMVALAKAIRAQFAAYAARLGREISSDVVARQLAAIEEAHAGPLQAARAERAAAEAALAGAAAGTPHHGAHVVRLARARAEEARLAGERERALARARGEVLEAGVFVSYGPAPVVLAIDDEVFGRNRVAIADKINESARGTARAAPARARADAGLAAERARRRTPALEHAWSVFIGQPLHVSFPAEAEEAALRLFRAGDGTSAMRALAAAVREALEAAAREGERPGDVYNSGAALSSEALEAYLAEAGAAREVRRVELSPADIPEPLRARWWYGDEPLSLVACFGRDGRLAELFRRVGAAAFKGLGDVVVWELCGDGGGPGALAQALGPSWLRSPG